MIISSIRHSIGGVNNTFVGGGGLSYPARSGRY